MNIQNWIIFNKEGSNFKLSPNPLIPLSFSSTTGVGAEGYIITDPSENAASVEITNGGYLYDTVTASYLYVFDPAPVELTSADASILTTDVSIFNPEASNTSTISGVTLSPTFTVDLSTDFVYPSVTYAGAIFLDPVSVDLVETEHLFIFEDSSSGPIIYPHDSENRLLILKFTGEENQIQFFTINENTREVIWSDELIFDTSIYVVDTPLTVNIGFRAAEEGVYERPLGIYHVIDGEMRAIAEIMVNAQAIGEDERFRTLLTNFGLPDPKDFPDIFKETDINEDMLDWSVLNPKSKHMILEHDKIMPYVGTYKALINALKWLGYDDITVREWFKNVKENKKISYVVPFNAADRTQTILQFSPDERKVLKKLNELSLNYCITRDTRTIDDWGTPQTENCYSYNIKEIFVKLLSLKTWLEKNIIGINARIIDVNGEGIYYERFLNLLYATDNIGYNLNTEQSLSPDTIEESSELIQGEASINLTLKELSYTKIGELPYTFASMTDYYWDPSTGIAYDAQDASALAIDASLDSLVKVGATFNYPVKDLRDIQWKVSTEKNNAGVVRDNLVTNPLFIYENEIRFYEYFDTSSYFYNSSTNLNLLLETAYFRDPSNDNWAESIDYSLYPNPSLNGYILEASTGSVVHFDDYMNMVSDSTSELVYAYDANYKVPLLTAKDFSYFDASGINNSFSKKLIVDILDGKILMDASGNNERYVINFQYDTSLIEQMITLNVFYNSDRMPLFVIDPSYYFWGDSSGFTGGGDENILAVDNSIHSITVNHIGDYNLELFGWDGYNTPFYNELDGSYNVWIKYPTIYTMVDNSSFMGYEASAYLSQANVEELFANNRLPIYDRYIPLQGISVSGELVSVPSITYFQDVPESDSINKFQNLTERGIYISGNDLMIDEDYQTFYDGDDINLSFYDKGNYTLVEEASSRVTTAVSGLLTLDQIPSNFVIDSSYAVYAHNDTYRSILNASNNYDVFTMDISDYTFNVGQLTGIIINDVCTGYQFGSSYRIASHPYEWEYQAQYETFEVDGLNIISAIQLDPGEYGGSYYYYSVLAGQSLTLSCTLTLNSGVAPYIMFVDSVGLNSNGGSFITLTPGFNRFTLTADRRAVLNKMYIEVNNPTNYSIHFHEQTFEGELPEFIINDPSKYEITVKHAFSSFTNMSIKTDTASEVDNVFKIYLKDSYSQEHYLDDTFSLTNILFDQDLVNDQWYDASLGLINSPFFYYSKAIEVDNSTLVILRALYDNSTYLLNQKNIWTVKYNDDDTYLFKVFNESVPYVFDISTNYKISVESYDSYGNLIETS